VTTVLFADLVGSTEAIVRLGAERAKLAFGALHTRMTRVIEAHAGEELQWLGDGLMAAFGSTSDAVRAAVALQRDARGGTGPERPGLRIGLNVGELQREGSGDAYFGLPVIVASRLCDRAEAGEILATSIVAGLLAGRRAFRFRELGAVELKGVGAPVAVCAVEYEREGGAPLAGATPFVGRTAELARLEDALLSAEAGRGTVLFVTGDAGIGKTRLVTEFLERARERGVRVLAGRCFEGEGARPYAPFAEALDTYAADVDRAELLSDLGSYGSEIATLAPRLRGRLPELPELSRLGGDGERTRLFYAVYELLLATARRAPLVLVLEDLHWGDGATIALLRYVARLAGAARLLVVGSFRDAELGRAQPLQVALAAMKREVEYLHVPLPGLSTPDVAALLAALAEHEVGAAFAELLAVETSGNPFFLRELLVHLVETGTLRREEGVWTSALPLDSLDVPEGVRQVVGRRLARLSPDANRLLGAGAACQGSFAFEVARRVAELAEAEALDALDEALDAQLLHPARDGGDRYEFVHDLVRHTLEAMPSPSRRARLHRQLAEAMEGVYGEGPSERSGEIARQFHASRELPGAARGAPHAVAAADRAERAAASEEAARLLQMGLDLLPEGDPRRPRLLARLALALARTLHADEAARIGTEAATLLAASEGPDAAAELVVAVALPVGLVSRPLAWSLASLGLRLIGDRRNLLWARLASFELGAQSSAEGHPGIHTDHPRRHEITRVVRQSGASPGELRRLGLEEGLVVTSRADASSLKTTFVAMNFAGDPRSTLQWLLESLQTALEAGDLTQVGMDLTTLAQLRSALGDFEDARGCFEWAARVAGRVSESSVLFFNLLGARASYAFARDEGLEALAPVGEQALERAAPDQAWAQAQIRAALACAYARSGRADEAIDALPAILPAIAQAPGWQSTYQSVVYFAAEVLWLADRRDHLDVLEDNVRTKLVAPDFRSPASDARLALARSCALSGRLDEASHWFAAARTALDEQGARPLRAVCDHDEAWMWLRRGGPGDAARALPLLERALAQFGAIGMPGWRRRAEALAQEAGSRVPGPLDDSER
jgi:class 3 adenylate cyclase/tetratricopeptide (TPR) repeat protein